MIGKTAPPGDALLAAIVESSDDAIISKSLDGVIQSWNAGAERIFGYSAGEAVGRHITIIIPPERIAEENEIIATLKAGRRVDHFETERLRKDGGRIQVSLTISPVKDEAGNIIGASKIARDITERKHLEDELRTLAADLSEASRRKDEFLAMLSHELRNPLAPMTNAVQVLRLRSDDSQAVRSASATLERQVRQLTRLVDDLLDMSRITRGKIELRRERTELAPVIHQAVEANRALYKSMNHELTLKLPPLSVCLDADPARLAQVVGNLLNNASKFTDKGGHISLTAGVEDGQAVLRVKDDGIGISPENLPALFEMFTQVDTSLERSRDGLGIGLTLVKTLVEMHGGAVEARSAGTGRGSEFIVRLPVASEVPKPAAPQAPAEPVAVPSRRILVVDDNEDGASSLAMLLSLDGHETATANDGLEALEVADRFRPEVVLLDIGLPNLNGYEVARALRAQPWGKDIVLIAVTGWGQEEDRRQSKEAGFTTHVVKPVHLDTLIKVLSSYSVTPTR